MKRIYRRDLKGVYIDDDQGKTVLLRSGRNCDVPTVKDTDEIRQIASQYWYYLWHPRNRPEYWALRGFIVGEGLGLVQEDV